ncbi:lysylphosphatidylglycerol synthase transmembrane domain-containing protein [Methanocrinis sp.]|uniref:lysylphosphatidylglycerol synthase transmembrane domain-containing protein n=1 Tax=Methanocrinis sp. TaxID=3101522 RepID=UPI003D13D42E
MNREMALPRIQVSKSTALVIFGLGIYLAYLRRLGFGEVAESLDGVSLAIFSAALVLSLLMVAFNALSWKRVAEELDRGASLKELFLIYLSSIFLNNLIPSGSFSGETARIYFLDKVGRRSRFDASFASVAASRIITSVPFLLGMVLSLPYLVFRSSAPSWALTTCFIMMIFSVSAGFALVGICFEERLLKRMVGTAIGPLERIFHRELDREVCYDAASGFQRCMHLLGQKRGAVLESLLWAFAGWLCLEMVALAAFKSLGVDVSPLAIFAVYSVIIVFQTLPLGLPGGVGLVEILMTALFSAVGIPIYDAAAVTILIRLVQLWFLALLGGISTVHLMRRIERNRNDRASSYSTS